MNARILLIAAILAQALMSAGGPIVRPTDCDTARRTLLTYTTACCCCALDASCPAPGADPTPHRTPDDRRALCCCVCVFLDTAPAITPPAPDKLTSVLAATSAAEPSFPILTGARAGTIGHPSGPPPPGPTLRRAILCCWTT